MTVLPSPMYSTLGKYVPPSIHPLPMHSPDEGVMCSSGSSRESGVTKAGIGCHLQDHDDIHEHDSNTHVGKKKGRGECLNEIWFICQGKEEGFSVARRGECRAMPGGSTWVIN